MPPTQQEPPDWDELYAQFHRYIWKIAWSYLKNSTAADDAVQDVFVKAVTRWERYDPGKGSVRDWIRRITTNHCLDILRPQRREEALIEDVLKPEIGSLRFDSPIILQLHRCFEQLPELQQRVYYLRNVERMTRAEISRELGISPYQVRYQEELAQASLLACMEENSQKRG